MKAIFVALASALFLGTFSRAVADCGDLAKRLFNVEVAGPRTYVGNLPTGITMSPQQKFDGSGIDTLSGKILGLSVQSGVYYHKDRVYMVLALIRGTSESDIENVSRALLTIANTDFDPNPKLVPKGEYLRCADGLVVTMSRSQIVRSKEEQTPILVMTVYHAKMKLRFECEKRPEQCRNLPRELLD